MQTCTICRRVFLDSINETICHRCQKLPNRTFYLVVTGCKCRTDRFSPWVSKILSNHPKRNKLGIKCPYCGRLIPNGKIGSVLTIRAKCHTEAHSIFKGYGRS